VSVHLVEMVPPDRRRFYVNWQSASQQAAMMSLRCAALLGYLLNKMLGTAVIGDWGWRISFFIGCSIIPVMSVLWRLLQETKEFKAHEHRPAFR